MNEGMDEWFNEEIGRKSIYRRDITARQCFLTSKYTLDPVQYIDKKYPPTKSFR